MPSKRYYIILLATLSLLVPLMFFGDSVFIHNYLFSEYANRLHEINQEYSQYSANIGALSPHLLNELGADLRLINKDLDKLIGVIISAGLFIIILALVLLEFVSNYDRSLASFAIGVFCFVLYGFYQFSEFESGKIYSHYFTQIELTDNLQLSYHGIDKEVVGNFIERSEYFDANRQYYIWEILPNTSVY